MSIEAEQVPAKVSNWEELHSSRYPAGTPTARVVEALTDLDDRVSSLSARVDKLGAREQSSLRLEALKAAREHLDTLATEQRNERGYRDHAMKAGERIQQELAVARYLLGQDE